MAWQAIQSRLPSLDLNQDHHREVQQKIGKQLTPEEIQAHPEYTHIHWDLKPSQKDRLEVAKTRGGPFKIAYELHGHGPHHIVWIMGLGGLMTNWQRQTKDFAHTEADKYTSLIFDNRGIGASNKPLLRYTTTEMAQDIVELLDHIGWTAARSVHVVGISMGGMIAQELGLLVPERVCSLNLVSTAPRIVRTLPWLENMRNRINLLVPKSLEAQIAKVKADCYSPEWLSAPDDTECVVQAFPTNGDRFAANEISKRSSPEIFSKQGFICQLYAAGFHHKSAAQLKALGDKLGRERILVFHGTGDHMIDFVHAEILLRELGGVEGGVRREFVEGMGHVGPLEIRKEFNALIKERVEVTAALKK